MALSSASSSRFAAAVALSALAHLIVADSVAPGSSDRSTAAAGQPAPSLSARLVFFEPEPPVAETTPPEAVRPPAPRVPAPPREPPASPAVSTRQTSPEGGAHLPDATYYGARQLDVYPALATPLARDDFTAVAAEARGRVLLLVLIDAAGGVDDVSVVDGGDVSALEHAARRAFFGARFTPAQRNGRAVKSRIVVEVSYGQPATTRSD